jgi:hypothetical protein
METLANLIEAILDQTSDNEIKVSLSRNKGGWVKIDIADNLGEIANVYEFFTDKALAEAVNQLQQFVDDQQPA